MIVSSLCMQIPRAGCSLAVTVEELWLPNILPQSQVLAIDWLGSAIIVSVSAGEATHKELKAAWRHTNKQSKSAIDQASPGYPAPSTILGE